MEKIDIELLINLVRLKEYLYSKGHKYYKDIIRKEYAWKEIAATVNSTSENCEKMWKSLREKYTRERKKITNRPSGSGATTTPVWSWFGDLQFLDECIQQRRVDRNSSKVITSLYTSLGDSVIVEEEEEVASGESYSSEFCDEGVDYESTNIDLNETLRNTESVESLLPNAGTTSSLQISEDHPNERRKRKRTEPLQKKDVDTKILETLETINMQYSGEQAFGNLVALELNQIADKAKRNQIKGQIMNLIFNS